MDVLAVFPSKIKLGTELVPMMFARFERTEKKLERIRQAGYNLVVKRECDFRRELKDSPEIDICMMDNPYIVNKPLNPRDAFMGGRTNANKLYYKVRKGEKLNI